MTGYTAGGPQDIAAGRRPDLVERLVRWSRRDPAPALGATTLHERLLAHARVRPHATAIVEPGAATSYGDLDRLSLLAARGLAAAGIGRGDTVAVCLPRGSEFVIAILAILRAGAAYLPLDVTHPAARTELVIRDAGVRVAIANGDLSAAGAATMPVAGLVAAGGRSRAVTPERSGASDLAYVIYTSGSTGRPKGVLVEHRNITALLDATVPTYGVDDRDVWTFFHSTAFDFSVWEVWGCLTTGGRLVVVPHDVRLDPAELHRLLASRGVTVLSQTPSAFSKIDEVDAGARAHLTAARVVLVGGEPLHAAQVSRWQRRYAGAGQRLFNVYGITETTVFCTAQPLTAPTGPLCPIGFPIPGWELYVVTDDGRLAEPGSVGEIWVAGPGVTRGYLGREDLTRERFVEATVSGAARRMYRSGDLGSWNDRGELQFHGRLDDQIKLRGHRIELAEVESAMVRTRGVQQGAAVFRAYPGAPDRDRIDGYVAGADDLDGAVVRREVARLLPEYMVPATVTIVGHLPLTANGKVDRSALPEPSAVSQRRGAPVPRGSGRVGDAVYEAWTEVLREPPGGADNFFESGGNSLLAAQLVEELRGRGFPHVKVVDVFRHPTPSGLAARLGEATEHLAREAPADGAGFVLACLPHAGAGASFFWTWKPQMPADVTLCPIQRTGREDRIEEPAHPDLRIAAEDAADQLLGRFGADRPIVVFGHSSGGMLAYQTTRTLLDRGITPRCLVVSGIAAPRHPRDHGRRLLDDDALMAVLASTVGYDHPALHHPDLRELVVPAIRADVAAHELYTPVPPIAIDVPILAVRGESDAIVTATEIEGWREATSSFTATTVPGGHMAPVEQPRRLADLIAGHLAQPRPVG